MVRMSHRQFGEADIDPKRVEKLLKRGWVILRGDPEPVDDDLESDNDTEEDINKGEA